MKAPPTVSAQEWDAAWREMLVTEKEVQRARDALAAQRRRMPWLAVEKEYTFDGPYGKARLLDLFDGRSRAEPRPSQRPRHTFVYASRATQPDLERMKKKMGWRHPWYTITDNFDEDFGDPDPNDPNDQRPARKSS